MVQLQSLIVLFSQFDSVRCFERHGFKVLPTLSTEHTKLLHSVMPVQKFPIFGCMCATVFKLFPDVISHLINAIFTGFHFLKVFDELHLSGWEFHVWMCFHKDPVLWRE